MPLKCDPGRWDTWIVVRSSIKNFVICFYWNGRNPLNSHEDEEGRHRNELKTSDNYLISLREKGWCVLLWNQLQGTKNIYFIVSVFVISPLSISRFRNIKTFFVNVNKNIEYFFMCRRNFLYTIFFPSSISYFYPEDGNN